MPTSKPVLAPGDEEAPSAEQPPAKKASGKANWLKVKTHVQTTQSHPWRRFLHDHTGACYGTLGVVWVLLGVWMFTWSEGCWVITSLYVITQIVTTIGYGDITPTNNVGKILTSFYALGTILFLGILVNLLIEAIANRVEAMQAAALEAANEKIRAAKSDINHTAGSQVFERDERGCIPSSQDIRRGMKSTFGIWLDTVWDFQLFALFILGGTIFYATYEKCTCSYGLDLVVGCEDPSVATCTATGGYTQTWVTSFYMCVITLTTVGFGDFAPKSYLGRLLFIPWAIVGCMLMANFAVSFGSALSRSLSLKVPPPSKSELKKSLEETLGGSRETVNELEFSWFLLHQTGQLTKEDETKAFAAFDKIVKGDGKELESTISVSQALAYVQTHLEMFQDECGDD